MLARFRKKLALLASPWPHLGLSGVERYRVLGARFMGEASEAKVFASRMRDDFFLAPLCTSVGGVCGCRTTDSSQYPERHRGKNIARIREDFVGLSGLTYKSECKCLILFISGEAKVRPNEAKQGQLFITSGEHGGI